MPHVAFVPMTGLRVRDEAMRELGMSLPALMPRAGAVAELPSLALLTLAGTTPENWTCSYHEADVRGCDVRTIAQLADEVLATSPALVATSAVTASIETAYALSDELRARGVPVVIGGLHATALPDEAALHAASVVTRDGESVWQDVLRDAERGELKPFYCGEKPFNLANAPLPRFELLGDAPRHRYTVQTQRGCPLACEFCAASRLLGPFREKPIERIDAELRAIRQRDPRARIEFADDNTFVGRRDAEEMLAMLAQHGLLYFTEADWRIGERDDLVRNLARSGCVQVLVGVESMVFRHPGMGAKNAPFERMMDAVNAIQASGVAVIGCFIIGADGETEASIDRMTQFIVDSPFADVQLTLHTPFPGTALHHRLKSAGRLRTTSSWSDYTLFDVTFEPDAMSAAALERSFRQAVRAVHSESAAQRRQQIRRDTWSRHPRMRPCKSETSCSS